MNDRTGKITIGAASFLLGVAIGKLLPKFAEDDERPTIRVRGGSIDVEIDDGHFIKNEPGGGSEFKKWKVFGDGDPIFTVRATGFPEFTATSLTLHFKDQNNNIRNLDIVNVMGKAELTFPDPVSVTWRKRKKTALYLNSNVTLVGFSADGGSPQTFICSKSVVEID